MAKKNFIYGIAAIYLGDMTTKIGYIEKGSWDWGGQKPEVTDVDAEQVPDAPVISLVNSNAQNNPTFNLIQLDYENIHRFLGGKLIGTRGWEAPSDMVRLHGRFYIEFASGQVMVIPDAAIYASMGGKLTLTEVSKIECQLEIHNPENSEKKYKIRSGWPCLLMQRLWDSRLDRYGILDATLYTESKATGARGESCGNMEFYYTRCVAHNGRYYVVEGSLPSQYNPYKYILSQWGRQESVDYHYEPDIIYYAESEDMRLTGSFRGEEAVPERASGGAWHRLTAGSKLSADNFMSLSGIGPVAIDDLRIKVGGRNMGSSAANLVLRIQGATNIDGGVYEFTLTWDPSEQSEQSYEVEIIGVPGSAVTLDVCNESGVTSNVCIDYVIIKRI